MIPEKSLWNRMAALSSRIRAPGSIPNFTGHVQGIRGQNPESYAGESQNGCHEQTAHADADGSAHAPCKTYPQVEGKEGKCSHHHKGSSRRNSRNETTSGIIGFTQTQSVSTAVKVQAVRQNSRSENFPI